MPANLENLRNTVDLLDQTVDQHLARDRQRIAQSATDLADRDAIIAGLRQQIADGGIVDVDLFNQLVSRLTATITKLQ